MNSYAVRKPWQNAGSIFDEGIRAAGLDPSRNNILVSLYFFLVGMRIDIVQRSSGLQINPKLLKVNGRILPKPRLVYGNKTINPKFGSWNMTEAKFFKGKELNSWTYLHILLPETSEQDDIEGHHLAYLMATFQRNLVANGITAKQPGPGIRLRISNQCDPELRRYLEETRRDFKFLVVILPKDNTALYKRIKEITDKELGLATVCCIASKLSKDKGQAQYMANIALKVNLKLGGINHVVDGEGLELIKKNKTMVVGIDVTHPTAGSASEAPSIAAMVASVDKNLAQWPVTMRIQKGKKEMVNDIPEMLKSRLDLWREKHDNALPENILIYRDGVSEGQYSQVLENELGPMRKACEKIYSASNAKKGLPRFTVIICGKRHKTRFFPTKIRDADRTGNTEPGTVVDRGITEARNWDFFLQSHAALQGTARPCHYFVVHDEIFRQVYANAIPPHFHDIADIVEDLTHKMSYTFGRATKAISYCPPAYYADLACERARCYMANMFEPSEYESTVGESTASDTYSEPLDVHPSLKDTMFYI